MRERVVLRIVVEIKGNVRNCKLNARELEPLTDCCRAAGEGFLGMPDPAPLDLTSCRIRIFSSHVIEWRSHEDNIRPKTQ